MKQSHKTLLLWVVLILMFLAIWQFLSPADRKPPVAFSEFVTDVHAGRVDEITIKDREYSFRVHTADGSKQTVQKETIGPTADEQLLQTLKPDNKDAPKPKIKFEKEDGSPFWSTTVVTLEEWLTVSPRAFMRVHAPFDLTVRVVPLTVMSLSREYVTGCPFTVMFALAACA